MNPKAVTHSGSTTIGDLPNELLANIFSHLDISPPSLSHTILHDQPTLDVTDSNIIDLKNCSTISKRWRQATLPLLFKHARYVLKYSQDDSKPILNDLIGPFLQFTRIHTLGEVVTSFALVVREEKISNCLDGRKRTGEFDSFWKLLFRTIDPINLLVAAPPEALGALTSAQIFLGDSWTFNFDCQYLRLQRAPAVEKDSLPLTEELEEKSNKNTLPSGLFPAYLSEVGQIHNATSSSNSNTEALSLQPSSPPTAGILEELTYAERAEIFQVRPWTSLLLNEGSFLQAYAALQWWERQPPSILQNLVGEQNPNGGTEIRALINPGIRHMEYIGIFPVTSHFEILARSLPRLDSLYVQLVPRNDILDNLEIMKNVEPEDLWMERNNCYAQLMREMFNDPPEANFRYLKSFESGDAADRDAWLMAVEFVKRAGGGWKVVSDGVFVKGEEGDENETDDSTNPSPLSVA